MRPLTYENADETAFLKSVYSRRNSLENTSFGILAPDGETHLVRSARSPKRVWRDAATMAEAMHEIAKKYPAKKGSETKGRGLPLMENPRFALNTAACDTRLLVVAHAADDDDLKQLTKLLTPICWSDEVIGQFLYVATTDSESLAAIDGAEDKAGVLLVKPGTFGLTGEVIAHLPAKSSAKQIRKALLASQTEHPGYSKDSRRHVREAGRADARWKSTTGMQEEKRPRNSGRRRGGGVK